MSSENEIKNIIPTDLTTYMDKSYLNYSMYVILDRALPRIEDGLKPVQRRIIYAMGELGLANTGSYKKSARTIGDVLGKYHPHGDSACYEAMVNMAQPFTYLTPLVEGQGNWGSSDEPKSFAAMRYTEAKMAAYTSSLLKEVKQNAIPFKPNFDGTLKEPVYLPAQIPNVLLNYSTGIAVGMKTDIPSHNMNEVVEATKLLIDRPDSSVQDLLAILKGPDLATGGIITNSYSDLLSLYETGLGSIRVRGKHHMEGNNIVFTELPFKVQGTKVLEQIDSLMRNKKLSVIEDLRDESDHENPIRLVISIKKGLKIDPEKVVEHLFSETNLEINIKAEFRVITRAGEPVCMKLTDLLSEWISYRKEAVVNRLQYKLGLVENRLHIVEGLQKALMDIDRVIEIIRSSENPKQELMDQMTFTEKQANYILDTKLRSLSRLEENTLNKEQEDLSKERDRINKLLSKDKYILTQVKKDMEAVVKLYGKDRQSVIKEMEVAEKLDEGDLMPSEPVTVVVSKNGWVRSAKGHGIDASALSYKVGDELGISLNTSSNKDTILVDNTGRSFSITNSVLPSARSMGDPISKFISPTPNSHFVSAFSVDDVSNKFILSISGYGYICAGDSFVTRQKKGKVIFTDGKTTILPVKHYNDETHIAIATRDGHFLIFETGGMPILNKGKGHKLIGLSDGDEVVDYVFMSMGQNVKIDGSDKSERYTPAKTSEYLAHKGRKGKKLPKTFGDIKSISIVD